MNARHGSIAVLLLCCTSGVLAQFVPKLQVNAPAASAGKRAILDVVVTDKSGKPVSSLQAADFTLLDNKQPVKAMSFAAATLRSAATDPLEIVLVVDEINADFTVQAQAREHLERFLRQDNGRLARPALMAYAADKGVSFSKAPTQDGNALIADLQARQVGLRDVYRAQGLEGDAERMQLSFNALQEIVRREGPNPGHKLVIWIGPGWPFLENPALADLTAKEKQNLFNSIVSVSNALLQARMAIYSVDPRGTADAVGFDASTYQSFLDPVKESKQAQYGNMGLQILATRSGGLVLFGNNDIAGEVGKCIADSNAFYELSFDMLPGDGPNEYHALAVKVDKLGLKARTAAGYYAQPQPGER